jgi:hypothetical protein
MAIKATDRGPEALLHPHAADALVMAARKQPSGVVAVILADGSVQEVGSARSAPPARRTRTEVGSLSSPDWVLWWQRRRFGKATA